MDRTWGGSFSWNNNIDSQEIINTKTQMKYTSIQSANQRYKASGSVLPFKDWLNREKAKGEVIPKLGVTDKIEDAINGNLMNDNNNKNDESNTILGLSKPILFISAFLIVGAVAYKYYYKK